MPGDGPSAVRAAWKVSAPPGPNTASWPIVAGCCSAPTVPDPAST
jgi:hypothetical protein